MATVKLSDVDLQRLRSVLRIARDCSDGPKPCERCLGILAATVEGIAGVHLNAALSWRGADSGAEL